MAGVKQKILTDRTVISIEGKSYKNMNLLIDYQAYSKLTKKCMTLSILCMLFKDNAERCPILIMYIKGLEKEKYCLHIIHKLKPDPLVLVLMMNWVQFSYVNGKI